jgi:hypothetical protein
LRILVDGDNVNVREQVKLALGTRLPELPELTHVDVETAPVPIRHWARCQNPDSELTSTCLTLSRPAFPTIATTIDGPVEGYA